MATPIRERATKWEPSPSLSPWVWAFVVAVVVVFVVGVVATAVGEHRMRPALVFEIGDEVPEGTSLVVISY